ncbi:transposable element Tcb2 transposase [Trichonephila clavipes]|nr:transposable element Tcb2 transposase [Trichonephila clavipes]
MRPILAYACPVWGYAAKTNINILNTLQNSYIRMIELVCSGIGVWKQWTDEHRTGSGQPKMTSARDNRHMLRMAVKDRTASSWQLAARWSTATGVLMSASLIRQPLLHRGLCVRVPLYRIPLKAKPSTAASAMGP